MVGEGGFSGRVTGEESEESWRERLCELYIFLRSHDCRENANG